MMRLRAVGAVLLALSACGGEPPPVELRTIAEPPAVVPEILPRAHIAPPTTAPPPTTSTTQPSKPFPAPTTTTPPPRPSAPPTTIGPAPKTTGGCGGWEPLVAAHFPPEQVAKACAVMACETGGTFSPTIHNPSSSASGLFQFLDSTWVSTTGLPAPAAVHPPGTQVAAAAKLWGSSGWGPWSCA